MIARRRETFLGEAVGESIPDQDSAPSARKRPTTSTETMIAAYTEAGHGGTSARGSMFDVAVRVYLARFPAHPAAAARIVADIISHRS
jgi:hypothetical protein